MKTSIALAPAALVTTVRVLSVLLLLGCNGTSAMKSPASVAPSYDRATLEMKYDKVYAMIKDLACGKDTDCSQIGIGCKPCGGPWHYVVYSTLTVNAADLQAAVADLGAYECGFNTQEGILSDCMLAPAARPACVAGICTDLNATH